MGVLTPAHFLVGEPLVDSPEENHFEANINWLTRWKRVQRMAQHFWSRWKAEYLNQLQTLSKWLEIDSVGPQLNELVLVRDETLPLTQYKRARVMDVHAGEDGLTRVVTLKIENKILKRPIVKICSLPIAHPDKQVSSNVTRIVQRKSKAVDVLPLITALLAVCVMFTPQAKASSPFEISKFDSTPGLYFEKMSDMYIVGANWNVLAYLNLDTLHG